MTQNSNSAADLFKALCVPALRAERHCDAAELLRCLGHLTEVDVLDFDLDSDDATPG